MRWSLRSAVLASSPIRQSESFLERNWCNVGYSSSTNEVREWSPDESKHSKELRLNWLYVQLFMSKMNYRLSSLKKKFNCFQWLQDKHHEKNGCKQERLYHWRSSKYLSYLNIVAISFQISQYLFRRCNALTREKWYFQFHVFQWSKKLKKTNEDEFEAVVLLPKQKFRWFQIQ